MDLEHFIESNYQDLLQASKNISRDNDLAEELLHYALYELLLKKNVQEIIDSGGAQFYIIRIMVNSWKSTTSPFYRLYRIPSDSLDSHDFEDEEYDFVKDETYQKALSLLKKLPWYDREVFMIFASGDLTVSQLARETKIPRTSLNLTINRVRKYLKNNLKA